MEVEEEIAAQAHANVGKGKEIVTQMLTVPAIWNAVKAMVSMTTAKLSLDFRPTMTAAMNQATPMVSNIYRSILSIFLPQGLNFSWIENTWKRLGLQLKDEIHFQFDFYRMRWWKWRTNLLHKLTPMWARGRRLWLRCWLCWEFEMRQRQLWYFPWISVQPRLLLWP